MDDVIAQLRHRTSQFNPPCPPEQLLLLPVALGCDIDPLLLALYADHDGMTKAGDFPFRFMSSAEVITTYQAFQSIDFPTHAFRAFWTDDNSNYVGYYTEGLLRGKVCFLDHEEPDLAPRYRSLRAFYDAALHAEIISHSWDTLPTDYPLLTDAARPEDDEADKDLAFQFITAYQATTADEQRLYLACCAMNVLPFSETAPLLAFAHDEDMWIQERACTLLGLRRIVSAVPILVEVVRTGTHNGKMAALRALGNIGTAEALEQLLYLAHEIEPSLKYYVASVLQASGYEVQRSGNQWHYRTSQSAAWKPL